MTKEDVLERFKKCDDKGFRFAYVLAWVIKVFCDRGMFAEVKILNELHEEMMK